MLNYRSKLFRALVMAFLLPLMSFAYGQEDEETWRLNLKEADVRAFVTQVADITGYSFVVDPRVKGKVTVLSSAPMNKEEIYDLFLAVLNVHGFTAIPGEEVIKIVQQVDAKQSAESLTRFDGNIPSEQLITRVIQIDNANALEMVPILRPLVAKYGHLAGVAAANALIISDHESNIRRIEQIVSELDSPSKYEVEVIQLQEAWVGDMVTLLQELAPAELGQGAGNNAAARKYSVTADERSNRLILRGDENFRDKIRGLIEQLDQPSATGGTTKVVRLKHADAKSLADIIKGVMGEVVKEGQAGNQGQASGQKNGFAVFADEGLNALVVRGEPSLLQEAEQIIAQLDVRRAQVMIEAAIVEISDDLNDELGVQFGLGDESTNSVPAMGTNLTTSSNSVSLGNVISAIVQDTFPGLGQGITLGAGERNEDGVTWGVLLQALSTSSAANLLSTPSIITLDNQESEIIVGQNVPFKTGQSTVTGDGTTNPFTTIERRDIGLTLKVKPSISADGLVRLVVEQTTEDIAPSVDSASDIVTTKREIKTTVLADDGETVVLGGLMRDNLTVTKSKVPLLGDIPFLGRLFSSTSEERKKTNLLVFLRPKIMLSKGEAVAVTAEKFQDLWEVNVGVREKLGLPAPEETPSIDSMFSPAN